LATALHAPSVRLADLRADGLTRLVKAETDNAAA
jgi:hypothetical protein